MGYNCAKKTMKKLIVTVLFLIGIGTCAFAQDGNNKNICPDGYKPVPASNNDHQVKVVTPSQCTTNNNTYNSGQNHTTGSGEIGGKVFGVGASGSGSYTRDGETKSNSTQTQQCTPERTNYYNCEPEKKSSGRYLR